jgi:uncharacterized sulfatase
VGVAASWREKASVLIDELLRVLYRGSNICRGTRRRDGTNERRRIIMAIARERPGDARRLGPRITAVALALAIVLGVGAWFLLRQKPIERLYGDYPPEAADYVPRIENPVAPRPNIVLIYADDLGYGDIGVYGNTVIRTPHINALAFEGIRFTSFYACSAVCAPSRAGLLTGRYPFRTGIVGNTYPRTEALGRRAARRFGVLLKGLGVLDIREDYVSQGISDHELTLAEGLRAAGYQTGMVGKWHLGDYSSEAQHNPVRHGFDSYLGVPYSNDMLPLPLYRDYTEIQPDLGHDEDQARLTGLYTEEALRFIREAKEPFFLYLAHTFPHQPLFASLAFKNRSRAGRFGDAVEEIDWSVGQIVELLRNRGLEDQTLVVFTSDNGPWYEGSAGSLRGRKGQSLEGGFRVPFIARWPATIPPGVICEAAAINLDLFPTLFALAGLALPDDRRIDGRDMLGLMTGTTGTATHEAFYFYHYDQLEAVRSGDWKYYRRVHRYTWPIPLDAAEIPNSLGRKQLGDRWPLLYDLASDPGESYNLCRTYPETAKRMEGLLEEWEEMVGRDPRGFFAKPDALAP